MKPSHIVELDSFHYSELQSQRCGSVTEGLPRVCWAPCTTLSTENKCIIKIRVLGAKEAFEKKCIVSLKELGTASLAAPHLPPQWWLFTENDLIQLSKTTCQWLTLRRKSQPLAAWMEASTIVHIPICPNSQVGRRNTGFFFFFATLMAIEMRIRRQILQFRQGLGVSEVACGLMESEGQEKRWREIMEQARQTHLYQLFRWLNFPSFGPHPLLTSPTLCRSVFEPQDLKTLKNGAGYSLLQ